MWVSEFHIDGFRLDAIHAIYDTSPVHVLTEFADAVRGEAARVGRRVHVIAESHDNDRRIVLPLGRGRPRPRRGVVRRLPSCAPPSAHRRDVELLRRLRLRAAPRPRDQPGIRVPGRAVRVFRAAARYAERRSGGRPFRHLLAEPRPGRQSPPGRSTRHARALRRGEARGRAYVRDPVHSAALHGRGVRRDGPLSVLPARSSTRISRRPSARGAWRK